MSDFNTTVKRILQNEGGYNRPFRASGETYKGIDRSYFPNWAGWPIIDAYKAQYGIPPEEGTISNPQLDQLVYQWYKTFLGRVVDTTKIKDQVLADFVADFLVHKLYDAVKVVNSVASQYVYNLPLLNPQQITDNVVNIMNTQPQDFYNKLFNARIAYYQNPGAFGSALRFSQGLINAFVTRVKTFPATIGITLNPIDLTKKYLNFSWLTQ